MARGGIVERGYASPAVELRGTAEDRTALRDGRPVPSPTSFAPGLDLAELPSLGDLAPAVFGQGAHPVDPRSRPTRARAARSTSSVEAGASRGHRRGGERAVSPRPPRGAVSRPRSSSGGSGGAGTRIGPLRARPHAAPRASSPLAYSWARSSDAPRISPGVPSEAGASRPSTCPLSRPYTLGSPAGSPAPRNRAAAWVPYPSPPRLERASRTGSLSRGGDLRGRASLWRTGRSPAQGSATCPPLPSSPTELPPKKPSRRSSSRPPRQGCQT